MQTKKRKRPKGSNRGTLIRELTGSLPTSDVAGRAYLILELLNPPLYDEYGVVIGHGPPLISVRQAKKLLNLK